MASVTGLRLGFAFDGRLLGWTSMASVTGLRLGFAFVGRLLGWTR